MDSLPDGEYIVAAEKSSTPLMKHIPYTSSRVLQILQERGCIQAHEM